MVDEHYGAWFERVSGGGVSPHPWQTALGETTACGNRMIRIPTGFGKTLGVIAAWLRHRVNRDDEAWPRRLVWCLPMRTLVEQTVAEAEAACRRLDLLWDGTGEPSDRVGVYGLMGGVGAGAWHLWPEARSILVGTQDMLLSRALNRGYGAARARWPMDFGLLGQDCLWVMDEVQLMDVGLATSAQLQAFREEDRAGGKSLRPCVTWWMSATLQRSWLRSVDTEGWIDQVPTSSVPASDRAGGLWSVTRSCELRSDLADPVALADEVVRAHRREGAGEQGPTLVITNTVDRALTVAKAVQRNKELAGTDLRIVHSRYRPRERKSWRKDFLCRESSGPDTDRIVIATQVVEAGVDFSAHLLFTDLAPWPSLVQRAGRVARWGGHGGIVVVDTKPEDDVDALPYSKEELDAAREAIVRIGELSPRAIEAFEESLTADSLRRLFPYRPAHLLLRHELDELFDTSSDLSGADIDVSRFVRSGDERDVSVFWAAVPDAGPPSPDLQPSRDALCAVPFLRARDWLCGKETKSSRSPRLKQRRSAWVWSWLDGAWREATRKDIYPGQTLLVDASYGGYDWDEATQRGTGWSPESRQPVRAISLGGEPTSDERADASQDDDSVSRQRRYRTIASHCGEVAQLAARLGQVLSPQLAPVLELAAKWHDVGKAHGAFQGSIRADDRPERRDLAKAPADAWPREARFMMDAGERRPGFRHELASTLALFAVLRKHRPDHPALLGPWRALLDQLGMAEAPPEPPDCPPLPHELELLDLDAPSFDLLAYLVCSHHGKVRAAWHASPADQAAVDASGVMAIRGVKSGDTLSARVSAAEPRELAVTLDLSPSAAGLSPRTGASWTERVIDLQRRHGPFALAWLEAILRAADQRASAIDAEDPLLSLESNR